MRKKGFSLIEAAIVLGIIGLVIGGIWAAASSVMKRQRLNEVMTVIPNIHQTWEQYRRALSANGSDPDSTLFDLMPANAFPGSFTRSGGTLAGNGVQIGAMVYASSSRVFSIGLTNNDVLTGASEAGHADICLAVSKYFFPRGRAIKGLTYAQWDSGSWSPGQATPDFNVMCTGYGYGFFEAVFNFGM